MSAADILWLQHDSRGDEKLDGPEFDSMGTLPPNAIYLQPIEQPTTSPTDITKIINQLVG